MLKSKIKLQKLLFFNNQEYVLKMDRSGYWDIQYLNFNNPHVVNSKIMNNNFRHNLLEHHADIYSSSKIISI